MLLEPEYTDGKQRIRDLELTVGVRTNRPGRAVGDLTFTVSPPGKPLGLTEMLAAFTGTVAQGHDPFVRIRFGPRCSLGALHEACKILASIESERGIRIEPPPDDQLYYRAFLPDEDMRDRDRRIMQPWELHLAATNDALQGTLVHIDETWRDGRIRRQNQPRAGYRHQRAGPR